MKPFEEAREVRAVFLDKSKAFDRVLHRCLIVKLRSIGVEGNLFNWLISYLSCRKQRAIIKEVHSDWRYIEAGVPQGSVLGPLLFLIYIDDLPVTISSRCFLIADDCFLLEKVQSPTQEKITDFHFWVFKEYPQKSQIWKSETSPSQGTWLGIPWLGLVSLCQIWDFCGYSLNTLKYPKMGIRYFFLC